MDITEAKEAIKKEKGERVKRCMERIAEVLKEENCELSSTPIYTGNGDPLMVSQVQITALD